MPDLIRARQFVQERLQAAIPQLPEGIFPLHDTRCVLDG